MIAGGEIGAGEYGGAASWGDQYALAAVCWGQVAPDWVLASVAWGQVAPGWVSDSVAWGQVATAHVSASVAWGQVATDWILDAAAWGQGFTAAASVAWVQVAPGFAAASVAWGQEASAGLPESSTALGSIAWRQLAPGRVLSSIAWGQRVDQWALASVAWGHEATATPLTVASVCWGQRAGGIASVQVTARAEIYIDGVLWDRGKFSPPVQWRHTAAHWQGDLKTRDFATYQALRVVGTPVAIDFLGERFEFRSRGCSRARERIAHAEWTCKLLSAAAWEDDPYAYPVDRDYPAAQSASAIAASELSTPLHWGLPDWIIPGGRYAARNRTPLQIAKDIAAACGGVVESRPDGSLEAVPARPVQLALVPSLPEYDHDLLGHEVLSLSDDVRTGKNFRQVRVMDRRPVAASGIDGAGTWQASRIVWTPDEGETHRGTVHGYVAPWQDGVTIESQQAGVVLISQGEAIIDQEPEALAISQGRGGLSYPCYAVTDYSWITGDAGAISVDPYATNVATPAECDYALLRVSYQSRVLVYRLEADTAVATDMLIMRGLING